MPAMHLLQRLAKTIKEDRDRLRKDAIKLELARVQGGDRRQREWDASRTLGRHMVFSAEFLIPYLIYMLAMTIHPPVTTVSEDLQLQLLSRSLWPIGFMIYLVFIYYSIAWIFYFAYFPFGYAAYVAATVLVYTSGAILLIIGLDYVFPGVRPDPIAERLPLVRLTILAAVVTGAIVVISSIYWSIHGHPFFTRVSGEQTLFAMMPVGKKGELVSVSADDHYVIVNTSRGKSHVRLKFSDVLDMLKDSNGVQIHRSHWVNTNAITDLKTDSAGKAVVTLLDESELPVARGRLKTLREHLATS